MPLLQSTKKLRELGKWTHPSHYSCKSWVWVTEPGKSLLISLGVFGAQPTQTRMSGVAPFNGKLLKDNANHGKSKPSLANYHEWCGNTTSHVFITPASCWTRKRREYPRSGGSFLWAAALTDCVLRTRDSCVQRSPCSRCFPVRSSWCMSRR